MSRTEQTTPSGIAEMSEAECVALLSGHVAGRVAFDDPAPTVLPVNYVYWNGKIAFRTSPDSPLAALADGAAVAFEIDDLQPGPDGSWSVLVRGRSHQVRSAVPFVALLQNSDLVPWAAGPRRLVIAIEPYEITGRRLRAR